MRRVVITGMGCATPLGVTAKQSFENLLKGRSGIKLISEIPRENPEDYPEIPIAVVHSDFDFKKWRIRITNTRSCKFMMSAVDEAVTQAGLVEAEVDPEKIGTCVGALSSNMTELAKSMYSASEKGYKSINRMTMMHSLNNIPVSQVSIKYGFKGPMLCPSTACSTGASAIADSYLYIKNGLADVMVAGGIEESLNPLITQACLKMGAMANLKLGLANPEAYCCPFDANRSGFVLGEGAGILVMESLESALARDADIICELKGIGVTSDADHLTKPSSEGALRAMKNSLEMAFGPDFQEFQGPSQISINTHATSTPVGDTSEAMAINSLVEQTDAISKAIVTANKGALGHCFGAAGAIESIMAIESLRGGVVPQILNLENIDVEQSEDVLLVQNENVEYNGEYVIKNSFGFGGVNVSLLLSKYS